MFYFFLNKHLKISGERFAQGTYPLLKEIKDRKGPWVSVAPEPSTWGKTEQARTAFTAVSTLSCPHTRGKLASVNTTK